MNVMKCWGKKYCNNATHFQGKEECSNWGDKDLLGWSYYIIYFMSQRVLDKWISYALNDLSDKKKSAKGNILPHNH